MSSPWPRVFVTSVVVVIMTSHHLTQPVILRPNYFPYFKDRPDEGQQSGGNGSMARADTLTQRPALSQPLGDSHPHPEQLHNPVELHNSMTSVNCSAVQNSTRPGCYYLHTSRLLRLLQRNFYQAVSS